MSSLSLRGASFRLLFSAALLSGIISTVALAEEPTHQVRLANVDLAPTTPAAADHTLKRIENAAMRACGATPATLLPMKLAIARSACFHDSVASAVAQVNNPVLQAAYQGKGASAFATAE